MAERKRNLAFVDTETTGLYPELHEIWEVGLILVNAESGDVIEKTWRLPVTVEQSDPQALQVNHFTERYHADNSWSSTYEADQTREAFAWEFMALTTGAVMIGAVPSFDSEHLKAFLRNNKACASWHYQLVDVETLIAGKLAIPPPWNSNELSKLVGVNPENYARHTAMGDCRWAKALYDAVMTPA